MVPIKFQVVGEEDYAFDVEISSSGDYMVNSGTYTSQPPRSGTLTKEQEDELLAAIKSLGIPGEHPMPKGVEAFEARLIAGVNVAVPELVFEAEPFRHLENDLGVASSFAPWRNRCRTVMDAARARKDQRLAFHVCGGREEDRGGIDGGIGKEITNRE